MPFTRISSFDMDWNFRTLNYLGSKLRLLDFISDNVDLVTPKGSGVCDLFAGSGCVSRKISRSHPVVACDIQHYSTVICNALLYNYANPSKVFTDYISKTSLSEKAKELKETFRPIIKIETDAIRNGDSNVLTSIIEHGSAAVFKIENTDSELSSALCDVNERLSALHIDDDSSLISRHYGGVYFSYAQAVQIDILLEEINTVIPPEYKDLFLAPLLSATSDIANTVGKHFAQPLKARDAKGEIKSLVLNKARKDKTIDLSALYEEWVERYLNITKTERFNHITMQGNFTTCLNALPENVRTIYADPPYTRDHYSRFYHVLETIALRSLPGLSYTSIHGASHISNGIYRNDRHQSPFCIKNQAPDAFDRMFSIAAGKGLNLILSYSPYDESQRTHPRVMKMAELQNICHTYYRNVDPISAGQFAHNKLNSSDRLLEASEEAEMVFVCTNPF